MSTSVVPFGVSEDLKRRAEEGDPDFQYRYAVQLWKLSKDPTALSRFEALTWCEKAASKNHIPSLLFLGHIYFDDPKFKVQGVCDYDKAFQCYLRVHEQGDIEGTFHVAWMYDVGKGVKKDKKMSEKLWLAFVNATPLIKPYRNYQRDFHMSHNNLAMLYREQLKSDKKEHQSLIHYRIRHHFLHALQTEHPDLYTQINYNLYRIDYQLFKPTEWPKFREQLREGSQEQTYWRSLWVLLNRFESSILACEYWYRHFPDVNPRDLFEHKSDMLENTFIQWDNFWNFVQVFENKLKRFKRCHCQEVLEDQLQDLWPDRKKQRMTTDSL